MLLVLQEQTPWWLLAHQLIHMAYGLPYKSNLKEGVMITSQANSVCHSVWQNTSSCVPNDTLSHFLTLFCLHLVWLLVISTAAHLFGLLRDQWYKKV